MICYMPGFTWMLGMLGPMLGPGLVPTNLDLKLMKELTTDLGKNEAISPFLMSSLMTQLWMGANGTTRDEMTPVLGIKGETFLLGYQSAITDLKFGQSSVTTKAFNGIYVKKNFSVKPEYACELEAYYSSKVEKFSTGKEGADKINTAVANATNNLIPQLVTPAVMENTAIALVSALYFKGEWHEKFNRTEPGQFLSASGERTVDMMKMETAVPYKKMKTFDVISLQYKDPNHCMLLLRPLTQSMAAVEALRDSLDKLDVGSIADQLRLASQLGPVDVAMPRFKIKTSYDELEKVFPKLGIKEVFTPGAADLGRMTTAKLHVSKIIHKVSIEVTEEGTEAAGAGTIVTYGSARPISFTLDRPFFAIVWNHRHRIIEFMAFFAGPQ